MLLNFQNITLKDKINKAGLGYALDKKMQEVVDAWMIQKDCQIS